MTREERFISYFTDLDIQSLAKIDSYFSADAHFKDPFNDVVGVEAIRNIFMHMFTTTQTPEFVILHHAHKEDTLFINWVFSFSRNSKLWRIEGCSKVRFNADNKVTEHFDFWDPVEQIYSKIGLLKSMMNFLTKQLRA